MVACRQHKAVKTQKSIKTFQFVDMQVIICMKITPVFFGDRLLLQVVVFSR
jgi:hypothetical protein